MSEGEQFPVNIIHFVFRIVCSECPCGQRVLSLIYRAPLFSQIWHSSVVSASCTTTKTLRKYLMYTYKEDVL